MKGRTLYALVLSLVGTTLLLNLAARTGFNISPDSTMYIAAARSLVAGEGWQGIDGSPLVAWPPLYPALIAMLIPTGLHAANSAWLWNAVFYGWTILLATAWLFASLRSRYLVLAAGLAVLFSPLLLHVSIWAWSETLFIFMCMLCIITLDRYLDSSGPDRSGGQVWLVMAIMTAGLASLTRYMGISLVIFVGLVLTVVLWNQRNRLLRGLGMLLLALAPLIAWLIRNHALSGTWTGTRGEGDGDLWHHVITVMRESGRMFFLGIVSDGYLVLVPLVILAITLYFYRQLSRESRPDELQRPRKIFLLICYLCVYSTVLIMVKTFSALDPLSPRLLAPLYLPAACFLFLSLDALVDRAGSRQRNWLQIMLLVVGIGLVAKPLYGYLHEYRYQWAHGPFGPHSTEIRSWTALKYLEDNPLPGPYYSNRPGVMNYHLDHPVKLVPRRVYYASTTPTEDISAFQEEVRRHGRVFIVWYRPGQSDWLWDLTDLQIQTQLTFTKVMESPDTVIYEISPALPAP